jgi:hypothetical protein
VTENSDGREWPEDENDLTDEQVMRMWREASRDITFVWSPPRRADGITTEACGVVLYERIWGFGQ